MDFYTNAVRHGGDILVRGIKNGKSVKTKVKYKPTLFVHCNSTDTKYRDIYGNPCMAIKFDDMWEAHTWKKENKQNSEILGMDNFYLAYLADQNPDDIQFDIEKIRIGIIDLEVTAPEFPDPKFAKYEIDAITLYDSIDDVYYSWGLGTWASRKSELPTEIIEKVKYKNCPTEKELLANFLLHWIGKCPDVISGWNSDEFDLPYLYQRLLKVLGESSALRLSPWDVVKTHTKKDNYGGEKLMIEIYGVSALDYMALYKKFTYVNRPFYKLGYIASVELGDDKLDFDGDLSELAATDYQKYMDYNIKDVWLVKQFDEKLALFSQAIGMAYSARINFDDAFSPVKMWDAIIFNEVKKENIVIPAQKHVDRKQYEGAYVKEPIPGFYRWVMSFDLTSLHPMLMNQYNISPETIRGMAPHVHIDEYVNGRAVVSDPEFATAANGMQYTKEFKGVIPSVALKVFNLRVTHKKLQQEFKQKLQQEKDPAIKAEYKKQMGLHYVKQMACKLQINSLYGSLGSPYFRYYNINNAEAVTVSSQLVNRWIERYINEYLNSILPVQKERSIAGDTDSNYFTFEDVVNHFPAFKNKSDAEIVEMLDQFSEKRIIPVINQACADLAKYMNAYDNFMSMKREAIASTAFWTAKKRYAMDVWDMEGVRYKSPEIKITGLETVKSSTPKFCVPALEECIRIILRSDNNELFKHIDRFEKEFKTRDYKEIAAVTTVNNIKKYSDKEGNPIKGCPMNVRAALTYNKVAKNKIKEGDKIGLLKLKEPNCFRSPVFGYTSAGLEGDLKASVVAAIDYTELYNKVFLAPLELMTNAIGWKSEDTNDLTSFFG